MPAITAVTLRFSRKFQISRDDWIGADALVIVSVSEEEAENTDPAEIRRLAIAEARQIVIEAVAAEYLERTQLAARAAAGQLPAGQLATEATEADRTAPPAAAEQSAPGTNGRPKTTQEAATRFFARYGEIVGGEDWKAVQTYLSSRAAKPTTVEGWFSAAEAVRDAHRMRTTQATEDVRAPLVDAQLLTDADRPQDVIADVEPAPPSPVEHVSAHTVSHAQPRPRAGDPPISTAGRARSAARRVLK
jgi:hypothetical protein